MRILKTARGKRRDTVICERCISGEEATYVVSSDVIHLRVCAACAEEARELGLTVTTRERPPVARGALSFQMKLGKLLGVTTACLAVCVIYSRMLRNCETRNRTFFGRIDPSMRVWLSAGATKLIK